MPCLMYEVGVCAYGVNLYTHCLELVVFFCNINQFGRTYKRKVCRIEEENSPFAFYVFVGYCLETSVLESLNFEFRKLGIDNRYPTKT